MFKWLTHHPDGHRVRPCEFSAFRDGWSIPKLHIIFVVPGGFEVELSVGFQFGVSRYKVLRNTDWVPYNEVIAPDDWRDAPKRPSGADW